MDKISKVIKKLSTKDAELVSKMIDRLISGDIKELNVKRLKGFDDIFRIKKGKIRIIFKKERNDIKIVSISKRNEKTYKDY